MAHEITYNNFETSLVVFMPNMTPNHAITYTNTGAFSCDKFSIITFSFLTRWLRNFAKNNRYHSEIDNTKYSDFIDSIYIFLEKLALKRTLLFKENRV